MRKKLIQTAFFLALGEVAYISLVALFFRMMEKYSGFPGSNWPFCLNVD